jgi:isopenicillin N synthase-like dioxygenase
VLIVPGVDRELLQKLQMSSSSFFDSPITIKQLATGPFGLGYMGQGTENVAATLKQDSQVQDYKESLNLTLPVRDGVWPDNDVLREMCSTYYSQMETLASQLMRLFALALNLDECFFDDKVDKPYTTLRLLNYPEFECEKTGTDAGGVTTRNAEHTDYGTLTILWSSDSRGLQALSRQGEWIDVVAPIVDVSIDDGDDIVFIINIGDLMMQWANDKVHYFCVLSFIYSSDFSVFVLISISMPSGSRHCTALLFTQKRKAAAA